METLDTITVKEQVRAGQQMLPLRQYVKQALHVYFTHLDGHTPANLYTMVLEEIEKPLFETIMKHVGGNQSKASVILGISRSTLRKKLQYYDID